MTVISSRWRFRRGAMIYGEGALQPDKAGSFGAEIIVLYKKLGTERYLTTAIGIADRLALRIGPD